MKNNKNKTRIMKIMKNIKYGIIKKYIYIKNQVK